MKGVIKPDHIPINKFQFLVLGLVDLMLTEIGGIEDELQVTELPDRTMASAGYRNSTEMTIKLPMHHTVEMAAMELWYRESQDPVSPGYKKTATLVHRSLSGDIERTYTLTGVFPKKRTLPDLELANEGEMAETEWELSVDDVIPV